LARLEDLLFQMNPRRILVALAFALCISAGATWFMAHHMAVTTRPPAPLHYTTVARSVNAGEVLAAEDITSMTWPADSPIADAISRPAEGVGREGLFPLAKGQPLTQRVLSAPGGGVGLASRIPTGMRAVALSSNEVVGVAGFVSPGSHLDVLVTYRSDKTPDPITATVLQDATAIAVGHQVQPDPQGKPADVTIVTLLLRPDDAERAVLASTQGAIHFILRNGSDTSHDAPPPLLLSQLSTTPGAATAPTTYPGRIAQVTHGAPPAAREPQIEVVLGGGR